MSTLGENGPLGAVWVRRHPRVTIHSAATAKPAEFDPRLGATLWRGLSVGRHPQRPAGLGIQEVGVIRNSPAPVSLLGRGYDWGLDRARGQPQASHVVGDLAHVRHP